MTDSIQGFLHKFPFYSTEDKDAICQAWNFLDKRKSAAQRGNGESYMEHPLRVAHILAELKLDADSVVCALLHGSTDDGTITLAEIAHEFGPRIASLSEGTSRLSALKVQNKTIQQAESVRKMFFAMVNDIRIIIIRLADRLDKMRTLKNLPESLQRSTAQETIDIWAPLANRLGISSIKDELEDLSLKFLNREAFDHIKAIVAAKKGERSEFLHNAEHQIFEAAKKAGIHIDVKTRAKHFWSIYQKMKKRNKAAEELFDLLAMRILCDTANECYTLLGLVHTVWKPLEGRFKDYIAMPKSNGYQSLHTTVICDEGRPLEIQIRTREMHHIAENGIASHWLYKKGTSNEIVRADHLSIIAQLRELSTSRFTDEDLLSQIKGDLLGDSIFVFTPKGDIVELPAGSTAIDFAYHIHTAVGEKIVGAKADGSIIPLSQSLTNTQVVEIITHPQAHPTLNQYNSARTAKARQKIRAWFHENDPSGTFEKTAQISAAATLPQAAATHYRKPETGLDAESGKRDFDSAVLKIRIGDTTNFLIKFANCCVPVPPEPILGYVSRGRGIIIHRRDCTNLAKIPEITIRSIPVEWEIPDEDKPKKKR